MGIKLLVKKDREKNEYRHYLQEDKCWYGRTSIASEDLCPEHTSYIVEIYNNSNNNIDSITYMTGTSENTFGKAGRVDV